MDNLMSVWAYTLPTLTHPNVTFLTRHKGESEKQAWTTITASAIATATASAIAIAIATATDVCAPCKYASDI